MRIVTALEIEKESEPVSQNPARGKTLKKTLVTIALTDPALAHSVARHGTLACRERVIGA